MYHRRFKNNKSRRILDIKGRFALMHMGGGTFIYSFPGRGYPVVGKIELARKKYRNRGFGFLAICLIASTVISLFSTKSGADPVVETRELMKLESEGRIAELHDKSDQIKVQLYQVDENTETPRQGKVKIVNYTVKEGDTLSSIALNKRVPASIIAASSGIKITTVLSTGMILQIPDRPGLVYRFKAGDTLAHVADHYSVKMAAIARDNPDLADLDIIEPGDRIFLPNAKIPAPPIRWMRPVAGGRFTSGFGWRRHPFNPARRHLHAGVDIGIAYSSVRAARDGKITYAGWLGSYGNAVVILHENGFKTLYAHLSRIKVRSGQFVKMGQGIAVSGNTGTSTGPHLHFEIIRNGRPVNPRKYMRF
ncbi:MAG: peptidoglycan DD-metalloendopeptidase family protein [Leptospiraceae bacterium]|nr:peptidoglycan DD-metalloendopeptidase family protein [Leptospiraceae bacterium]